MEKKDAIKRLETIVKHSECDGYHYAIKVNDWEKHGKSRTYFSIVETRNNSKHFSERRFGYIDNLTGEYVAEKNDLTVNYTFSGAKFEESETAEITEQIKVIETGRTVSGIVAIIEKITANFEELMQDRDDIEMIKSMHKKFISNIKKDEFGMVTEDFAHLTCDGRTEEDWQAFMYYLDESKFNGRDYRK